MRLSFLRILLIITALTPLLLAACSAPKDKDFVLSSSGNRAEGPSSATLEGQLYSAQDEAYMEARELKLKIRELAEQLVADMRDCSLNGVVALPTSFVNLNDFNETSSFGRLLGEQLFYELNQRGYPVREYRTPGAIQPSPRAGEFALSRELGRVYAARQGGVIVLGTYSVAENAVFVNARLVWPRDGRVLRTANLVLEANPTVKGLLNDHVARNRNAFKSGRSGSGSSGLGACAGTMRIKDFSSTARPRTSRRTLTAFDLGADIH